MPGHAGQGCASLPPPRSFAVAFHAIPPAAAASAWLQAVEDIHLEGGTMLGTSEDGECDAMAVVKCLGAMCATCCCSWCRSLLLRPSANAAASGLSSIRLQIQC